MNEIEKRANIAKLVARLRSFLAAKAPSAVAKVKKTAPKVQKAVGGGLESFGRGVAGIGAKLKSRSPRQLAGAMKEYAKKHKKPLLIGGAGGLTAAGLLDLVKGKESK